MKSDRRELRPCIIMSPSENTQVEIKAYFHRWCDKTRIVDPSYMVGGHQGGVLKYTVALVEYADGRMGEWIPKHIRFTDVNQEGGEDNE